ncbi:fibronectin type III domain-containing protein [Geomobilimonas luticola]|uniref:Fibronectin type III domain-containing protein n=1 Tax=Geomobilimonas luticola TaxID=1114878 RepID=A0ABS5S7S6_9BACT|nr:fibronectin type III domain-containing protein [Geomobilimonas luticola]MBT0651429.1 fibronectin type III domain-containing protein [Geomobilimonas luticola]
MKNKHGGSFKSMLLKYAKQVIVLFLSVVFVAFPFTKTAVGAAAPTAPMNLTATVASSKQINLTWQDHATNEASYYVERAPAPAGPWKVIATLSTNVTSYPHSDLTQNTTYYYRVRCKAGNSYSGYSNIANAKTATLAPPTTLSATVVSATKIDLAWADNTPYEANYFIERATSSGGPYKQVGSVGTNVTTYSNTRLTDGTFYHYRVRAYDGTNYSEYSNVVNQTIRTIASSAGPYGSISPYGTTAVDNGASQTFVLNPNNGYHVLDVLVDGISVGAMNSYTFVNVTANHTIDASFAINPNTINAKAIGNGTITPSGGISVNTGASATFTMAPDTNYHIDDVLIDVVSVGPVSTYTFNDVTTNHSIVARFAINTYTITTTSNSNGAISPSGTVRVNSGTDKTFTITPITGSRVIDVLVDGVSVGAISTYTFKNINANHTISASFTASSGNDDTNIYCQGFGSYMVGPSNFGNGIIVPPAGTNAVLITSPSNGSTINGTKTIVKGAMDTTVPILGVIVQVINTSGTINYPAEVNGTYFASEVQLPVDNSTIKVIVTDQNNVQNQDSVTVNATTKSDGVTLQASPNTGIPTLKINNQATHDVSLTSSTGSIANPVSSYSWDFDGAGTNSLTCFSHSTIKASYEQPGLYLTSITVTDTVGTTYTDTVIVNVLDKTAIDAHLQAKWGGMKNALTTGNTSAALNYIHPGSREKFNRAFRTY